MTRKEQILKVAEFSEDAAIDNAPDENMGYTYSIEFVDGAKWQNRRLMPLITAMADENERLRETIKSVTSLTMSWVIATETINCRHTYNDIRILTQKALTTPTALDALLKGE